MLIAILLWLVFGAVVGWLAGVLMKSRNSLGVNILLGVAGSVVGGFIASLFGLGSLANGFSFNFWNILISIGGACLVIYLARLVRR